MSFIIRPIVESDIDTICQLREELFAALEVKTNEQEMVDLTQRMQAYLRTHLNDDMMPTWIVTVGDQVAGCGSLTIFERIPYPRSAYGREAYLSNMYTRPTFQKMGIASAIVETARKHAIAMNVSRIWLHSSEAGWTIYEKAGFEVKNNFMELQVGEAI